MLRLLSFLFIAFFFADSAFAQLERERVQEDRDVELTFMAPRNINLYTVHHLSGGELHYSIMHTFGEVTGGVRNLWGIDQGANVRFSFEYGITDHFSIVTGRSSMDKVIDIGTRISLLRQTESGSMPVSISVVPLAGVNSSSFDFLDEPYTFSERLNYSVSLPIARKITNKLSMQLSPIAAHYNRVGPEINVANPKKNSYITATFSGRYKIASRTALSWQYIPSFDSKVDNPSNFAVGVDIETGGHVFQMFFTTSQALHEPYLAASENGGLLNREFRFGFNINRLFGLR